MKWIKTLLFVGVSAVCVKSQDNDKLEIENLFYCNGYHNITKLWIINDDQAIGARASKNNAALEKDLVLLNRNGLVKDSILFEQSRNDYSFKSIEDVFLLNNNTYAVITGHIAIPIRVSGDKMEILNKDYYEYSAMINRALYNKSPELILSSIWSMGDLVVGYERAKSKISKKGIIKKVSNKDISNFPTFWIGEVKDSILNEIKYINQDNEKVTDDIFIDWKDWYQIANRTAVFGRHVTYHDSTFFFNVTRANRCYIYDLKTKETAFFTFPDVKNGESNFYYYDYLQEQNYFVKKNANKTYEVYSLSNDFKEYKYQETFESMPQAILGGKVHLVKEQQEKGRAKVLCHYLIPLNGREDTSPVQLKNVTIKEN